MANIRDLKKDINFVLGDIIDAVYLWEALNPKEDHARKQNKSHEGTKSKVVRNKTKFLKEIKQKS